jgi:hypothetical protein
MAAPANPLDWDNLEPFSQRKVKLSLTFIALGLVAFGAGCHSVKTVPPAVPPLVARVFLEARPQEQGVLVTLPISGAKIEVDPRPVLLEFDLERVEVVTGEFGRALLLYFGAAATRDLYQKSAAAPGRRFVLSLNGSPVAVFAIEKAISSGTLLFYPEMRDEELPGVTERLQQTTAILRARRDKQK